jgi:O-antigen/teichoic acid export membrane protein
VYAAGLVAIRLGSLALLPIYWRYLTPAEYGVLALCAIVVSVVTPFLGLALSDSILRFYHTWPAAERAGRTGSVWAMDWLSSAIVGIPLLAFAPQIFSPLLTDPPSAAFLRLAILAAIGNSLTNSPLAIMRSEERDKSFVLCSLVSFVIQATVGLSLVAIFHTGVIGILWSQAVAPMLMVPIYVVMVGKHAQALFNGRYIREAIEYSAPLIPGALIESVTPVTDRFILQKYVPLSALGLYSLADMIASGLRVLTVALKSAWIPFQMRVVAERDDAQTLLAKAATTVAFLLGAAGLIIALLGPVAIVLTGRSAYYAVGTYLPLLVVPYILNGLQPVFAGGIAIAKRTGVMWISAAVHLIVGVSVSLTLIPRFGVYGAVAGAISGYGSRFAVGLVLATRSYHIPFETRKLLILFVLSIMTFVAGAQIPAMSWFALPLRLLIIGAYGAAGFLLISRRTFSGLAKEIR